ncbi:SDR family oxidoreductase [Pseudorhodoplanes sp.]|uniref:SDR family oxidoreductase n=1 Tax=Pseudorhodoplanes sp. TaxID=1934341 RepID=UPI003D12DA95
MSINNKKVVVVGGSSGIGYATAAMAKKNGADVVIASRPGQRLESAAKALGIKAVAADVTSDEAVENLFRETGPVDHVVVTAAVLRTGPIKTLAIADAKATMESKFWGAWRVARFSTINAGGSLTIVSGFLSVRPRAGSAIVGAANGALESLVKALAIELAPVRVNAVSPGMIDTPIRAAMAEDARRALLKQLADALPVKRVGLADDIALPIIGFMENGFATGSVLFLDGGGSIA